ncbi:glycosyltransferase family A protein [Peribacillus frigoritolerans]|uniref:glycosyltransferase family A protein n=1 Tax=Peribacillus castrilensis TaxID=2897690 RepID=UPI002DC40C0F|nr:glycosyltransferase family A protein [Peribacillus castrilensis]
MSVQVLVAAMHRTDHSILEEMNISSNAIVVNQCDRNSFEKFKYRGQEILFLSYNERGVGLSRNNALMRASDDICVFADEDMIYVDGYTELIENEFKKNPKADIILFSLESLNKEKPLSVIKESKRVGRKEAMRYGCARIAFKRERLIDKNIWFSLLFGGGTKYSSGEDTIFLQDCLKKGLRVYKSTVKIADVKQEESTWFEGYTEKLFFDKGVLLATVMPNLANLYALGLSYKYAQNKSVKMSFWNIWSAMKKGINVKKNN